jgi:hypothetical protein
MAQKAIQGDQLDLTDADGSVLTAGNADLLQGNNSAWHVNADNLSAGTVPSGRLSGSYGINVTGSSAYTTGNAATATLAADSSALGGDAAALYAKLASPTFSGTPSLPTGTTGVTQSAGAGNTRLATTLYVDNAVGSAGYTAGGSWAYTGAGQLITFTHNLNVFPKSILIKFTCVIADGGFAAGDATFPSAYGHDYSDSGGNCCGYAEGIFPYFNNSATNGTTALTTLYLKVGSLGIHLGHRTSGNIFNPNTSGRWNIVAYVAG